MSTIQDLLAPEIPQFERTTGQFTATLRDEANAVVPASLLTALTLSLFLDDDPTIFINSRNAQNVLNANGVTVDEDGLLTWTIAVLDNVLVNTALPFERHRAQFTWTFNSKIGRGEVVLVVRNLQTIP